MSQYRDEDSDGIEEDDEWTAPIEDAASPRCSKNNRTNKFGGTQDYLEHRHDHSRTIVHIDIDCFYAQVEMLRNPELRNKPLGIQQKSIVVTCNYLAREKGVSKCSLVREALQKCPDLVLVNGEDLTRYREMSYKITDFLVKYTPHVERLGFDENFLDVSELVTDRLSKYGGEPVQGFVYGSDEAVDNLGQQCSCGCHKRITLGSHIAADIREALHYELGITSCAGIAHNKLLAKLVGSTHKPNKQTTLFPGSADNMLLNLAGVGKIPGIGSAMTKRLALLNICTVQDMRAASMDVLKSEFGPDCATNMVKLCHGIDETQVVATGKPQSISDEDSFRNCCNLTNVQKRVFGILDSLLDKLAKDGRYPQTLRLTVRRLTKDNHFTARESRQCPIPPHVMNNIGQGITDAVQQKIHDLTMQLFHKLVDVKQPFHITLINICFTKLEERLTNRAINRFFSVKTKETDSAMTTVNGKSSISSSSKNVPEPSSNSTPCSSSTRVHGDFKSALESPNKTAPVIGRKKDLTGWFGTDSISCTGKRLRQSEVDECSKRTKYSTDIDMGKLPSDIDRSVFEALPVDMQKEILKSVCENKISYSQNWNEMSSKHRESAGSDFIFDTSNKESVKSRQKTSDHQGMPSTSSTQIRDTTEQGDDSKPRLKCKHDSKNEANDGSKPDLGHPGSLKSESVNQIDISLQSVNKTVTSSERVNQTIKSAESVNQTDTSSSCVNQTYTSLEGVNQTANLPSRVNQTDNSQSSVNQTAISPSHLTSSESVNRIATSSNSVNQTVLPSGIDISVFNELPPDVQRDMLDEWKQSKAFSHRPSNTAIKGNAKSKVKQPKTISILNFFPKK